MPTLVRFKGKDKREVWYEDSVALSMEARGAAKIVGGYVFEQRKVAEPKVDAVEPVVAVVEEPEMDREIKRKYRKPRGRNVKKD